MMSHKKLLLPALVFSASLHAQPFAPMDTRSMAMGDTGVASARPGAAGLFNPALLSAGKETDHVHIIVPNLGLSLFADPDALDAYNDIEDEAYLDEIDDAIEAMENAVTNSQFISAKNDFTNNASGLNNGLDDLSEQPFRINAAAFAAISAPRKSLGLSAFASTNATIETSPNISECDDQLLEDYINFFDSINSQAELIAAEASPQNQAGCNNTPIITAGNIADPTDDLTSDVLVAGVTITEVGVALAKEIQLFGHNVALGVTPKLQTITSYYALPSVQDLDNEDYDLADDLEASENDDNDFNLDLGVATTLMDDSITLGLVIKNIISNRYKTSESGSTGQYATFDVDTQARVGVAWDAPMGLTFAADLDLTKNKPYFLGEDTQFLGAGVEWDIANLVRLRGGVRSNLADSDDQMLTAGVGFNIVVVHFDLAAQFSDNNVGGALQLGVDF